MKKEEMLEILRKTNEETKLFSKRIADAVNADKELDTYFQKWAAGTEKFEKRYDEVAEIQKQLREAGYDIKINMQSYQLSYYGLLKEEL